MCAFALFDPPNEEIDILKNVPQNSESALKLFEDNTLCYITLSFA